MTPADVNRSVSLTIPAKPDYIVLARLALSAVCRIAPLEIEAAADLKLATTEAATYLMGGDRRAEARDDDEPSNLQFLFDLQDEEIVVEIRGAEQPAFSEEEREMSWAIIGATVDESDFDGGTMRLRKRLGLLGE